MGRPGEAMMDAYTSLFGLALFGAVAIAGVTYLIFF